MLLQKGFQPIVFNDFVQDDKVHKGGIQQLRGQEEGEGGSTKSPRLSTQGGGGPLNVHVDQNLPISKSILYHCALKWVVKKK